MSRVLISLMALYHWDEHILDGLQIPSGLAREPLIAEMLAQLAELNLIITDPVILKEVIKHWSATKIDIWQHLFDTTQYKYNPIWNKDGTYTETETRDLTYKTDGTETRDLKGSLDQTDNARTSAFNSNTMQPTDQLIRDQDTTEGGTVGVDQTNKDTGTVKRERREQGNIGIVTTQQMIKEEREIADFSLYQLIIDEFKTRFCIMVY